MRTKRLVPSDLGEEQRALYDAIVRGPRSKGVQSFPLTDASDGLEGPFDALLYAPKIGTAIAMLGEAIRFGGRLPARTREIAILELARIRKCEFEWYAHSRVGRDIGLSETEIEALRTGDAMPVGGLTSREQNVRELVRLLTRGDAIDEMEFVAIDTTIDRSLVLEVIALVGYYDLLGSILRFWDVPLPNAAKPVLD